MAKAQLKTLCLTRDAIALILDCAIIEHVSHTGALNMHDLNGFHSLIDCDNLDRIRYPDFSIHNRKNLMHEKISSSPTHILALGSFIF